MSTESTLSPVERSFSQRHAAWFLAWLPFWVLLGMVVPFYQNSFDILRQRSALFQAGEWLLDIAPSNLLTLVIQILVVHGSILLIDFVMTRKRGNDSVSSPRWWWSCLVVSIGVVSAIFVFGILNTVERAAST
ncbi:MAG: hypothetical protein AAGG48_25375 [Planctomycetota bacterium]